MRLDHRLQIPASGHTGQDQGHIFKDVSTPGLIQDLVTENTGMGTKPLGQSFPKLVEAIS